MLKWLLRRWIAAFERDYGYDASYVHDILEASPRAALAFARAAKLGEYRRDLPAEAWYAAKLATTVAEDCGPCTQLVVTMAERAAIAPALLRAILARNEAAMSTDALLAFRFAEATLAHAPAADALREEILRRWGPRALVSLTFAIANARLYPTVKYALGHGKTCLRVTIGDATTPVQRRAA
jgi:hypothetical protein